MHAVRYHGALSPVVNLDLFSSEMSTRQAAPEHEWQRRGSAIILLFHARRHRGLLFQRLVSRWEGRKRVTKESDTPRGRVLLQSHIYFISLSTAHPTFSPRRSP